MNNWGQSRNSKLRNQAAAKQTDILAGVAIWINGLVGCGLSNLQFIEMVQSNGGATKPVFSKRGCTHMVSVKELSASKTHKELSQISSATRVVHPQWVIDSVAAGHRLPESRYDVLDREWQPGISKVFEPTTVSLQRKVSDSSTDESLATPPPASGLEAELAWLAAQTDQEKRDPNDRPSSAQPHR